MRKIKIKNFGPIKNGFVDDKGNEWINIKKITVFIGNQGAGKSCVAKLISTLIWIEKVLTRGDYSEYEFTDSGKFKKRCGYHKIKSYFSKITEIKYEGIGYIFKYTNRKFSIKIRPRIKYVLPQLMYVPAERNLISIVNRPDKLKIVDGSILDFLTEFEKAKNSIIEDIPLPINGTLLKHDRLNNLLHIRGKNYKVRLTEASSGFQSVVPLYMVSWYLSNKISNKKNLIDEEVSSDELQRFKAITDIILSDKNLTDSQIRAALESISTRFNKTAFINIVEEPEQNLFPSSQRHIINSLVEFANKKNENILIITTHSPYVINYLTLAVKANMVLQKTNSDELKSKLNSIVPLESTIEAKELAIYKIDDSGAIKILDDYNGLPSDENYLNDKLAESNELFTNLLEIEDLCQ